MGRETEGRKGPAHRTSHGVRAETGVYVLPSFRFRPRSLLRISRRHQLLPAAVALRPLPALGEVGGVGWLEGHPDLVRLAAVPRHGAREGDRALLNAGTGEEDPETAVVDVRAAPDLVDGPDVGEHPGLVALEAGQLLLVEAAAELRRDLTL